MYVSGGYMKWIIVLLVITIVLPAFAQDFYNIEQVNEIELIFEQDNWDQILDQLYVAGDEERLLGTAIINGVQFDSVGVRYKGNSSYSANWTKNPLNIKLDYVIDDQLYENYGTLKLANGFKDPSFVRETLSYEIARKYMPASLANYANVYVNDTLIGLYTSVQDVDKYFGITHFQTNERSRFKGEIAENAGSTVVWGYLGESESQYYNFYEIESDEGWDDLIEFLDIFNNSPDQIESVLNVDRHLWMLAFDILMINLDAPVNFGHNYYIFQDAVGRFNPILWDLNENFGVFANVMSGGHLSLAQMQQLTPLFNIDHSNYPIISQVLSNDRFRKKYIAHMRTMIEENFDNGWYETRALEIQSIIDQDYQSDPNKLYPYAYFEQNLYSSVGSGPQGVIVGITELMDVRSDYLLDHGLFQGTIPLISDVGSDEGVEPGSQVLITAQVSNADIVLLGWRDNDSDAFAEIDMTDNGDGSYDASITVGYGDIEYYVYAENSDQGAFFPARAQYEYETIDVVGETGVAAINEINYNSPDDASSEDWIELYNPGTESVNLSGWVFKDEDDDHAFQVPDGTILEPDSYLVIVEDTEAFADIHPNVTNYIGDTGFGLSGGGELLRLFDLNETMIDSVEYDDEAPWPNEPDGNGPTLELTDATADNSLASSWQASYMNCGTPGVANSTMDAGSEDISPIEYHIRAYPNPFNPSTTIRFDLPEAGEVELAVYNVRGQRVATLAKGMCDQGEHAIKWDGLDHRGTGVSSGVYLCRLTVGAQNKMLKMILMK